MLKSFDLDLATGWVLQWVGLQLSTEASFRKQNNDCSCCFWQDISQMVEAQCNIWYIACQYGGWRWV